MLSHLLDTSVYSQLLKPKPLPSVDRRWEDLGDEALAISAICHAEILFGLELKQSARLQGAFENHVRGRLTILPVDEAVADAYAKLKAESFRAGQPRGEFDLLIAATAKVHRLTVATLNHRHFQHLEGVAIEDWSH